MDIKEHLLVCLAEEASEIVKDITKSLRFGLADRNVLDPDGPTNVERLVDELNDLNAVLLMCVHAGLIPETWQDVEKQESKRLKVLKFMRYAEDVGALQA